MSYSDQNNEMVSFVSVLYQFCISPDRMSLDDENQITENQPPPLRMVLDFNGLSSPGYMESYISNYYTTDGIQTR